MDLILTIIEKPETVGTQETKRVFNQTGGTLGRSAKSAWQFADKQRLISNTHAKIDYVGGQYLLIDESTNGVRLNDSSSPLGKGNHAILSAGDTFQMGGITLQATFDFGEDSIMGSGFSALLPAEKTGLAMPQTAMNDTPAPTAQRADAGETTPPILDSLSGQPGQEASQIMDPLLALNGPHDIPANLVQAVNHEPIKQAMPYTNPLPKITPSDNASGQSAEMLEELETNKVEIPENWNASQIQNVEHPTGAPIVEQPQANTHSTPEINANINSNISSDISSNISADLSRDKSFDLSSDLGSDLNSDKNAVEADKIEALVDVNFENNTQPGTANGPHNPGQATPLSETQRLLAALGLSAETLPPEQQAQVIPLAANIVRETLTGLITANGHKRQLKQTHRLNQTTIGPCDNNPLKFSASLSDALHALFVRPTTHYLTGPEAIKALFIENEQHTQALSHAHAAAHEAVLAYLNPKHDAAGQTQHTTGIRFKTKSGLKLQEIQSRLADTAAQQKLYDRVFQEQYEHLRARTRTP